MSGRFFSPQFIAFKIKVAVLDKKNPRFWGKPRIEIENTYIFIRCLTIFLELIIGE